MPPMTIHLRGMHMYNYTYIPMCVISSTQTGLYLKIILHVHTLLQEHKRMFFRGGGRGGGTIACTNTHVHTLVNAHYLVPAITNWRI